MKIINRNRRSGKTTMLIHTAYVTGYPIVVKNSLRAEQVKDQAESLGCGKITVISFAELNTCYPSHNKFDGVLVDEATDFIEIALERLLMNEIKACTLTIPFDSEGEDDEAHN